MVMSKHVLRASALFVLAVVGINAWSADDTKDETGKRFKEALQGKWQMTSRIQDGTPSDAEIVKNRTITFAGDKYTVRDGETVIGELNYTVDPAKKPAWLDVSPREGESAKGIVKLE